MVAATIAEAIPRALPGVSSTDAAAAPAPSTPRAAAQLREERLTVEQLTCRAKPTSRILHDRVPGVPPASRKELKTSRRLEGAVVLERL